MTNNTTESTCSGGCGTPTSACEYGSLCATCYERQNGDEKRGAA